MKLQPTDAPMRARLRDVRDLHDAMRFSGKLTIRELAELCGNPKYRSTIAHLHAGTRNSCTISLAGKIERALRVHPHALFTPTPRNVTVDATDAAPRKKAA